MTEIRFIKNNGNVLGFDAFGHSGAGEEGNDIVCAAISAVTQYTAVIAEEVLKLDNAVYQDDLAARLTVKVKNGTKEWYDVVKGLEIYLTELQKLYPDNLKVTYTEV